MNARLCDSLVWATCNLVRSPPRMAQSSLQSNWKASPAPNTRGTKVPRVEPICSVLPVAPSTYHERVAQRRDPSRLSARAQRDEALKPEVMRVFAENFSVYGVRKAWRQTQRRGFDVARCTGQRLMRELGRQGVIRRKPVG